MAHTQFGVVFGRIPLAGNKVRRRIGVQRRHTLERIAEYFALYAKLVWKVGEEQPCFERYGFVFLLCCEVLVDEGRARAVRHWHTLGKIESQR